MKKITSLMMMLVLCCVGAYAQAATEWADKLIRIGAAQAEMVPGKWYFLHTPRNPNQNASAFAMPGETIQSAGGLAIDKGVGNALLVTPTTVIDELTAEAGVSANDHMDKLVRFVAVDGVDGAYNIQFGTGNWLAAAPGSGTVSNNQYIAGEAGQYNFYLVTINGQPNEAGRFGWNKYNMTDRVDNNGAGNGIVFWASGETVAEGDQLNAADGSLITGNKIWQIYEVEDCGTEDPWERELNALINTLNSINERNESNYLPDLRAGINVGDSYGNYRPEDVKAFLEAQDKVEALFIEIDQLGDEAINYLIGIFETVDNFKAYHEAYKAADEKVRSNKIPLAVSNIAPGYYTINNVLDWFETKADTVYYTQEECNQLNAENGFVAGDEGFLTPDSVKEVNQNKVPAPIKSLCSRDSGGEGWLAWGTQQPKSEFLWKIENVEGRPTEYRLINTYRNHTYNNLGTSYNAKLVQDDTVTVLFDYRDSIVAPVINEKVLTYSIRNTYGTDGEDGYHYVHCGGHSNGAGKEGWIVGWSGNSEASRWYLTPIDDKTADEWINGDAAKVRRMVKEANAIVSAAPAQFKVAKDIVTTIFEQDSVVTDASQFYSQYTTEDQQAIPEGKIVYDFLLDGKPATYWHSKWEDGDAQFKTHYLQISANETLNGLYAAKITRRPADGDQITSLAVKGYETEPTDETTFEEGKDLGTLDLPLGSNTETLVSAVFDATGCNYLRFYSLATKSVSNGSNCNRGYWHASEFNVFKAEQSTYNEKTQYEVRSEIINKLQAAMDVWAAAEYDAENAELINDEAFNAAYKALIEASEAWKAVYVDPAALREAIKTAPADNLFVIGNNPGQWKAGSVTPAATVNEAKAYDETATYTPAESEKWIKAIADATAEAFASANKVETGKWYRLKFPTEAMYDTYEWSKTGAKNTFHEAAGTDQYLALFGKTAAAGKSLVEYVPYTNADNNPDTLATYKTDVAEELYNGNQIYFFDDEQMADITNGEDLFRFIQATDSSYIVQNKATGLFLRGGQPATLSNVPSYFYSKAIGAGASLITYTNVLGEKVQHCNLHGERSTNRLVCWEANAIGSNSSIMIETVEDVTEEPSTEYTTRLWPGSVYAYTTPVDVTIIGTEATAYGAQLVVNGAEGDTAVVLKKIEAETIKAGTPYILIADNEGDYITPADRLKEIAAEVCAAYGQYGYVEKQIAQQSRDEEYVPFAMSHGMAVDTLQKGLGDLVGTFRDLTVKAGKGLVTKNNGFAHTLVNTTVGAYGAYVKCDFDPESADVLGTIVINKEGSIETGIDQVLDKVAKSGNIYTVDGKLVGKGNINAVNNLPAGVYIVNGVKVTKN